MTTPRVPGDDSGVEMPCGETASLSAFDMGMREFVCPCGEAHAVVMDVHPPARFLPESIVEVLRETVETTDDSEQLGTHHLMGIVMEEFPEAVAAADVEDDGDIGCGLVWVTSFDSRRLHEIVVELVVDLMEHAISHAEDESARASFEDEMQAFDVGTFVETYRERRDFDGAHDSAA